jgi:hypothetical protein
MRNGSDSRYILSREDVAKAGAMGHVHLSLAFSQCARPTFSLVAMAD